MSTPSVVLVHDWLTGMRGGEKVLLELCRLFPEAPVYTLLWNRGSVDPEIEARVAGTSLLQRLPGAARGYRRYLPLFPLAARSLNLGDFDLVVSSSHAVAKAVRAPPGAAHVSYIHTPMRYAWDERRQYFPPGSGRSIERAAIELLAPYLRRFDRRTAAGPEHLIANSRTVQRRIQRYWKRDAQVIEPPVDTDFFCPSPAGAGEGEGYLLVSSLEAYKRVDLALGAFRRSPERLTVVGDGTQAARLARRASSNVRFEGRVSNDRLRELYRGCRALVFPGLEDFGIVPVEAMACGRPVICYGAGGASETVLDGETGLHFRPQSATALVDALERSARTAWDPTHIRRRAEQYSRQRFRAKIGAFFRARYGLCLPSSAPRSP